MNRLLWRVARAVAAVLIVETLAACVGQPKVHQQPAPTPSPPVVSPVRPAAQAPDARDDLPPFEDSAPLPPALQQPGSLWLPVRWAELPGFDADPLHEAWNAWIKSCERPAPVFVPLCPDIRMLSLATGAEQRNWMRQHLQPYRVVARGANSDGLLTAYFEPVLPASRLQQPGFSVPLYGPPASLSPRKPWYTRKEMETLPEARAALLGQEIAWLTDPVDALMLQIQGSGRLQIKDAYGVQHTVRLAYAATNAQPYGSVGRWLLDQGLLRDASWPAIRSWVAQNPQRVNEMLWSNPRTVFFREEPLSDLDAGFGPRGAQGVPLTPGRSIAVDRDSIPYGTPVWLASAGPVLKLQRLVLAQDTGSAIVGALRADYFVGWGPQAGDIAGRLKQPLQLWALWPKQ